MIPNGWEEKKLTDIIEVNPRRSLSKGENVKFVEMAAVSESFSSVTYIKKQVFTGSGSKFQNNDTLFARITPCAENGKTSFVNYLEEDECGAGSTEFIVLAPKIDKCFPKYLYYLARWERIRSFAISNMEGTSGRQRVPARVFNEIILCTPPLSEQKNIAEILTSVDDAIQAREKVIEQTKKVKQGLLQELLTRGIGHIKFKKTEIGEIPESWEIKSLDELSEKISDGIHSTPKYVSHSDFSFINGNNLQNGKIVCGDRTKFVSESEYNKHQKPLGQQTILLSINGTIGNLAFYEGEKVILGKSASFINLKKGINKKYIYYMLGTPQVKAYFNLEVTGTTIRNLSIKSIKNLKISVPSNNEQDQIVDILESLDECEISNQSNLNNLTILKSGLMQDLLTGRVRTRGAA